VIRRGKGRKDRLTVLPTAVIEPLSRHLEGVKRQHQADLARGFGRVVLPFALDRKYPNAPTEWAWQFVFPASRVCTDPRWRPPTRFHLHESVVQKAWRTPHGRPASPNAWVHTPSGIRLRLTCSRTAMTFGRCRSCWGSGCQHDDGVHARAQSRSSRRAQSRRPPLKGVVPFRWPRAHAANAVFAANHVHDRCDGVSVNIRAQRDIRSEYGGRTVAYGRGACDRSTP
jgi:hypothetical protein